MHSSILLNQYLFSKSCAIFSDDHTIENEPTVIQKQNLDDGVRAGFQICGVEAVLKPLIALVTPINKRHYFSF